MKPLLVIASCWMLACAGTPIPLATDAAPQAAVEENWSLHVVTVDADGSDRVTRIWIAFVESDPVIRTNQSRWWSNLERDPTIRIRLSGRDYSFRSEPVNESELKSRIDEAFLEKYGGWERLLFPQARGETHDHYARLRR